MLRILETEKFKDKLLNRTFLGYINTENHIYQST